MSSQYDLLLDGEGEPLSSGSTLSWEGIRFQVGKKEILKGINGEVTPGSLCAIMGPSGAGKSTLLNVLSGRLGGAGKVSGSIRLNGEVIDPVTFRSQIAYVMQEDALFATQTPREALAFSAALRLPSSITFNERTNLVEQMLNDLGLVKCANTYIGNIMIKGISGGEKKRTAIGVELISDPSILFLDEPTSGLDSKAAFDVVTILKSLANNSTTIICTIHQPSSEVFDLFETTLLLAEGQLVYHAGVQNMLPYFAEHGHVCKPNYNPADFVMFLMQQGSLEDRQKLAVLWANHSIDVNSDVEKGENKIIKKMSSRAQRSLKSLDNLAIRRGARRSPNVCVQLGYLSSREFRNVFRDIGSIIARIAITVFLNLVVGLVFKDSAKWTLGDYANRDSVNLWITNHFGALVQTAIGGMFGLAQPTLLSFPLERPVFLREYRTGTYAAWPYFLSKVAVEIPLAILQSAIIYTTCYFLIGFQGDFLFLTLATALLGLTAASTSLLIGSTVSNVQVAIQLSPLLFVPQLLFSGFFISITKIPQFLRWAQYLCALKYGINLLLITEFDELPAGFPSNNATMVAQYNTLVYGCPSVDASNTCADGFTPIDGTLFPRSEVEFANKWLYMGILLGVFAVFRITACITLSFKARR